MRINAFHSDQAKARRDLRAGTCLWHVSAVASRSGVVAMLGTPVTAKINPSEVPGGHPKRGEP